MSIYHFFGGIMSKSKIRVAIIGAGPSGLALARHLSKLGIVYEIFEKHSDLGGLWNIGNENSPIYESAHLISSKHTTYFSDHPMPDDYADYPSHRQVFAYLKDFAERWKLVPAIQFDTEVLSAERLEGGDWRLSFHNRADEVFSHLVCASGVNWFPKWPNYPGRFSGAIMHSKSYKEASQFKGERVLVVGGGNSACDIACDSSRVAKKTVISLRRGYHFIPKHILGQATDVFSMKSEWLPLNVRQFVFKHLLEFLQGSNKKYGLPPVKHKILESHPTINSQLLYQLRHGSIQVRPDIARFEGKTVHFQDQSRDDFDRIVYATGYNYELPYLKKQDLEWKGGRPKLDLNIFHPRFGNVFFLGFVETNGGAFKLFDSIAHIIARRIWDETNDPQQSQKFRQLLIAARQQDLSGGVRYIGSDRHATYVNMEKYRALLDGFAEEMGWGKLRPGYFQQYPVSEALPPIKWAVVSGGAGRIAQDLIPGLLSRGYRVFLYDKNEAGLKRMKDHYGHAIEVFPCDLRDRNIIPQIEKLLESRHVELLINNAGIIQPGTLNDLTWSDVESQIDVNFRSTLLITQALARQMVKRKSGKILNIISQGALVPMRGSSVYSATKFGLRGFFQALALELRPLGIQVSSIFPAGVNTPSLLNEIRSGGSSLNLLGKPLEPQLVARELLKLHDKPRLELDLPFASGFAARVLGIFPRLFARLLEIAERLFEHRRSKLLESLH